MDEFEVDPAVARGDEEPKENESLEEVQLLSREVAGSVVPSNVVYATFRAPVKSIDLGQPFFWDFYLTEWFWEWRSPNGHRPVHLKVRVVYDTRLMTWVGVRTHPDWRGIVSNETNLPDPEQCADWYLEVEVPDGAWRTQLDEMHMDSRTVRLAMPYSCWSTYEEGKYGHLGRGLSELYAGELPPTLGDYPYLRFQFLPRKPGEMTLFEGITNDGALPDRTVDPSYSRGTEGYLWDNTYNWGDGSTSEIPWFASRGFFTPNCPCGGYTVEPVNVRPARGGGRFIPRDGTPLP